MYQPNAYSAYTQNNVSIESPQKLIEMLYEGVLRFNTQAKRAINDNDIERRTYWINRSNAVFTELINSLDYNEGRVAAYLGGLYNYQLHLLIKANIENDATYLDQINQVMRGLLEAWRETTNVAE